MDKRLDDYLEGQLKKEVTLPDVAEDMVALIPDDVIKNIKSTYLDINCKTGVFLIKIRERIMKECEELIEMYPNPKERRKYIDNNMLYGISWIDAYAERSRVNIYGKVTIKGNIHYVPEVGNENKKKPAYKTLIKAQDNGKLLNDTIKEICKMQFKKDMSFDVVIGNPPYNDGMDIDFVFKAFQLATKCTVMITPAKCFTSEAEQKILSQHSYGDFRKELAPHISNICFYPECSEVFDIQQVDGICWFLLDKNIHTNCVVVNKCENQKLFNNSRVRSITAGQVLNNLGNEIVEYLGDYNKFRFNTCNTDTFAVWTNNKIHGARGKENIYQAKGVISYASGQMVIVSDSMLVDMRDEVEKAFIPNYSKMSFSSNNKEECESFISWLNCKFTRFFVAINISKLTGILTDYYFRFVPAPPSGRFDHIYSDEELYEYFGLNRPEAQTKDGVRYRDIIEAVVKERK